jgi:hypothetical protein
LWRGCYASSLMLHQPDEIIRAVAGYVNGVPVVKDVGPEGCRVVCVCLLANGEVVVIRGNGR